MSSDSSMLSRYLRAETLEQEALGKSLVLNAQIIPHWIDDSDCFWYCRSSRQPANSAVEVAIEYRLVNAKKNTNITAFDHVELANELEAKTKQVVDPLLLPIENLEFDQEANCVLFDAFERRWQFDGEVKEVDAVATLTADLLVSPDGTMAVFVKDYNLWVRDLESHVERALTWDGEADYAYATQPEGRHLVGTEAIMYSSVEALWAPDSSQLFTLQTDERQVRSMPSMLYAPQDGTVSPRVVERKYALPGDAHVTQYRMLAIDVATAKEKAANYPPIKDSMVWQCPFSGNLTWWCSEGRYAYFVEMTRGQKSARLVRFDTQSGLCTILFEESSSTYLELGVDLESPSMLIPISETSELLWPSERSGWMHLYLYDLTSGELKNAVTAGEWLVRNVLHFDNDKRELWVQIAGRVEGRNPYYRELARVNIDTGEITLLASGNYDYCVCRQSNKGISCSSNFVITTRSRVDEGPISELRDRHGKVLLIIEESDTTCLPQGWQWPESVTLKADDGITDIYGVVFRPSDFDPNKLYPVLDMGMIMPFYSFLPTGAFLGAAEDPVGNAFYMTMAALAELGFIVTIMDGRGTPYRSKAFHDFGYGDFLEAGGIVDHVAGIKQLAERYSYMDLNNIGCVSTDGTGNGGIIGLLNYPDFYKVGVTFSPWDPRLLKQGEVYCGIVNEAAQQQQIWHEAVQKLQGKLLLVTGMLEQYFHSSMTFQIVDAIAKANKDLDLIIQPNGGHGFRVKNAHRRVWDYIVRNLQGREPPKDFKLVTGLEKAYPSFMSERIEDSN